jgi:putative oxidoreductase
MKNAKNYYFEVIRFLLIFLWVYAASSKLLHFGLFKIQMQRQILYPFLKSIVVYTLPLIEISTALLLLFKITQKVALYLSFLLLGAFSIYVGLAVFKVFKKVPCSCGGILSSMTWKAHFVFNLFYLLLTAFGIYIFYRERRNPIKS